MNYKVMRANRELFKGFVKQRVKNMIKLGLDKTQIISYYQDILEEMKNEELFKNEEE